MQISPGSASANFCSLNSTFTLSREWILVVSFTESISDRDRHSDITRGPNLDIRSAFLTLRRGTRHPSFPTSFYVLINFTGSTLPRKAVITQNQGASSCDQTEQTAARFYPIKRGFEVLVGTIAGGLAAPCTSPHLPSSASLRLG